MATPNFENVVSNYYRWVDEGDTESVLALFDASSRYRRADVVYEDKRAIEVFYRSERGIRGRHTLGDIVTDGRLVVVNGVFRGVGSKGDPRQIAFTDWWRFNDEGLVTERVTHLAAGADYVRQ